MTIYARTRAEPRDTCALTQLRLPESVLGVLAAGLRDRCHELGCNGAKGHPESGKAPEHVCNPFTGGPGCTHISGADVRPGGDTASGSRSWAGLAAPALAAWGPGPEATGDTTTSRSRAGLATPRQLRDRQARLGLKLGLVALMAARPRAKPGEVVAGD